MNSEAAVPMDWPTETIATIDFFASPQPRWFDYTILDPAVAADARATIARIKTRLHSSVCETGRDLIRIKRQMSHGQFGSLVACELGITLRTAENYMNAARFVKGKSESISLLPPSAIYALAAPSAPPAIVEEVLAAVDAGTLISVDEIRQRLNVSASARGKPETVKSIERLKRARIPAKHGRGVEAAQPQRDQEEEREYAETERNDKALCVAQFLFTGLSVSGVAELLSLLNETDWDRVEDYLRSSNWLDEQQPSADNIARRVGSDAQS